MSRISRAVLAIALLFIPAAGNRLAAQQSAAEPRPDTNQLLEKISSQFNDMGRRLQTMDQRMQAMEKGMHAMDGKMVDLQNRKVPITLTRDPDTFIPHGGICEDKPSGKDSDREDDADDDDDCEDRNCQVAYVPATRVQSTWVTSHKKVKITKQVPYVVKCKEWDPIHCCYRTVYATRYKERTDEVIVPYRKEVVQEVVGIEKIKVCLDDV